MRRSTSLGLDSEGIASGAEMLEGVERRDGFQERQFSNTDDTYGNQVLELLLYYSCSYYRFTIHVIQTRRHSDMMPF